MLGIKNVEAEVSVLGTVLVDGTLFKELFVEEEHFYHATHRQIFRAMKKVASADHFIDMVTVTTELGSAITQVGGTTYLLAMAESIASTAPLKHHEQLIVNAYRSRKAREFALRFSEHPTDQELERLITQLQACRDVGVDMQGKTIREHLIEITEEMCFPSNEPSGFSTSYTDLDEMTGGLQRGELIVVAARPSVGKTAFALNVAAAHAKNEGSAMIFSLEMGTKQLLQRMISAEGRIHNQKWRNKLFNTNDYERALRAVGEISTWNLMINDHVRTITSIGAAIRKRLHDEPEARHLVIIDYLQLMTPTGQRERRDLEIGEMTRELKSLAVELHIPIVLISQLSRSVESRQNKRPLMSDLRESGNIEQDADVISFLYRDDYYDATPENQNKLEIILSKQRNGPTGTVELHFDKEYGRFENE